MTPAHVRIDGCGLLSKNGGLHPAVVFVVVLLLPVLIWRLLLLIITRSIVAVLGWDNVHYTR